MSHADLVVKNANVYTVDSTNPRAEALAVKDGKIVKVGKESDVVSLIGPSTEVIDAKGQFVMPGLIDNHIHLNVGGAQAAFELPIPPWEGIDEILQRVKDWAGKLGPDEWVVGGIIGSVTLDKLAVENHIEKLDEAAGGRAVLLRDDSLHNRWVNSRALELMKVDESTPDPHEGKWVKDAEGKLTGVVYESGCNVAEAAFRASVKDIAGRTRDSLLKALEICSTFGVTSVQEAATAELPFQELYKLDQAGKLNARVVTSAISRPFLGEEFSGEPLYEKAAKLRGKALLPDFIKIVLDGVPLTRTSVMLGPYRCCHGGIHQAGDDLKVPALWTFEDLKKQLSRCYELGLGAKMHATGDGAVRLVLDAVEAVRKEKGAGAIFQVAHAEYIHKDDMPRFKELDVVADMSPIIWYPCVIQDSIAKDIPQDVLDRSWPAREFLDLGVQLAGGSDWPVATPTPDPWTGVQTLVTRANPDQSISGTLAADQGITLEEAIHAFTAGAAKATGLENVAGRLKEGFSADFLIIENDLFKIDIKEVYKTKPKQVYFCGKLVHENK